MEEKRELANQITDQINLIYQSYNYLEDQFKELLRTLKDNKVSMNKEHREINQIIDTGLCDPYRVTGMYLYNDSELRIDYEIGYHQITRLSMDIDELNIADKLYLIEEFTDYIKENNL